MLCGHSGNRGQVVAVLAAAMLLVLWWAGPLVAQDAAAKPGRIVLKQQVLKDKGSGDMESHTVLAPVGWKVDGGAWWAGPNYFSVLPSQDIIVTAPDGRTVRIGPALGAKEYRPSPMAMHQLGVPRPQEGGADGGYPILYMPDNLEQWQQFLQAKALPQSYPEAKNIRVQKVVVVPELTAVLQKQLEPMRRMQAEQQQQMRAMGMAMNNFMDAAVLSASASYEMDGKQWDHLFIFGTMHLGTDNELGRQLWWTIEPNVSYRAPAGELDASMPLLMTIANSVRPTPQWARMKSDHQAKMNQIAAKGAADRSRIIAESNREISRMINDGYEQRMKTMDETHRKVINTIREVDDYSDPERGGTVQLPHHYDHVYSNGKGEYILSNDALFDPNTDPVTNDDRWNSIEPVKK